MSRYKAADGDSANLPKELQGTTEAENADQGVSFENKLSRDDLVKNHMRRCLAMETLDIQGGIYDSLQVALPTPYLPSVAPFQELQHVHLNDLRLNSHHRGVYVLLRAITPPLKMAATLSILEDEIGDAVLLQFYHQDEDIQPVSEGRVCIIKEPWYKMMTYGSYGIRVDHISDVTWLPKADGRMPLKWQPQSDDIAMTAVQLKDNGNAAIKVGKLFEAIESYGAALQVATTPEEAQTIRLNRSLANLRIGCFEKALEDAGYCTAEAINTEKGLYRAARSLYELGRFREGHRVLGTLLRAYPDCDAAKKELRRTEDRLREQDHGIFNFLAMHKAAAEKTPPCLEIATYVGPITIKMTESRGRGLFTTRDVAAGDLLLCEKAFSYSFSDNSSTTRLRGASTLKGTPADLVTKTAHQLIRNPSLNSTVTSLDHGTYEPVKETTVDGMPIVDTFLIHRIIFLNAFESSRASIVKNFGGLGVPKPERGQLDRSCGLYIKASYINHSCYSNVRRSFIGDALIVRATRNIAAGQEILFWYALPKADHSYEKTQDKLQNWSFHCNCEICTHDQETSNKKKKKRAALLKELDTAGKHVVGEAGLANIERLLAGIEQTYTVPAAAVPRLSLWDPYLALTRVYASIQEPERTIMTAWKVLAALGLVVKRDTSLVDSPFLVEQWGLMADPLIETWVHLWTAYECLVPRRPELCDKAEEYARTTYKICIGEDQSFEEKVGSVTRKVKQGGGDLGMASMTL